MRSFPLALTTGAALLIGLCAAAPNTAPPPLAGSWMLEQGASRLSFVTIKAGEVVEAHRFDTLSGSVAADGTATFAIDLASARTGVDVRDQRLRDILFQTAQFPKATVTTRIDPAKLRGLAVGAQTLLPVEATLDLHGASAPIETTLAVTRIARDKVEVETSAPIIVDAGSFGLEGGLAKLQELASLPSITAQVPVTFSLVFDHQGD
ncbi:YceI family protein [Novosphingobium sp. 1949]|uniref:YceI family protein n=1 Tax=Novosphingobium organovorum TaxID=2930092 RepID=A0ABT0BH31_9SPHN|nr:YceI family protein [Novosphingobium organovorum]MCJ2184363.1 YceI family protein [Novosphingobium organovorum]